MKMSEISSRVHAAWAVLRGHAVIRNVTIREGVIEVDGDLSIFGNTQLIDNRIVVPAPVVVKVGPHATWGDSNTGDAIQRVDRAS